MALRLFLWTLAVIGVVAAEVVWFAEPDVRRGDVASMERHLVEQLRDAAEERRLGSAALVLVQRGKIVAEHAFGAPVDPERTRFRVGSVSKAVTAWGVMRLVQDGRLGLDEPVLGKVTVRHLLTHTSGIDDGTGQRVVREPGTSFSYASDSYLVLQRAIETVTKRPFDAYMQEAVLQPLGMTASGFDCRAEDLAPNFDADLKVLPHPRYPVHAGVSLCATPRDLARFAMAFSAENPVLTRATLRQMIGPQPMTSGTWGLGLALFAPNVTGHDGGVRPAGGAVVRVNPTTGDALVLTVTGGSGAINRLGGDWIWWETGVLPPEARRELVYARLVPALLAIVAGAIAIVALQWRSRATRSARDTAVR
ncbi:MAG TPA: serine hydrolase domain-containing protein [Thermoanaerobaculia bacterium]